MKNRMNAQDICDALWRYPSESEDDYLIVSGLATRFFSGSIRDGTLELRYYQSWLVSLGEFLMQGSLFVERQVCFHVCPYAFFDVLLNRLATSVCP
jgi:hypothetical protein